MATPFTDIYCLNTVIKNDSRLVNKPQNALYKLYYEYLKFAISYFRNDCNKNLDNHTGFVQSEYSFVGDGVDDEFLLSPAPTSYDNFYIETDNNGLISTDYTYSFDENTNLLTITPVPPLNADVYVSAYGIGSFVDDLNMTEKVILAEGMNVPWQEEQLNKQSLLNHIIYGGGTKMYSQGEHIKQVKDVSQNQYFKLVKGMINEYSYKENLQAMYGLGGDLV